MKKEISNSLIAGLIIFVVGIGIFSIVSFAWRNDEDYMKILGIREFSYQYFDELLPRARSEDIVELDLDMLQLKQDGYDIFFHKNDDNAKYNYSFMRIEVYDPKYKFDDEKIFVGVSKDLVVDTYSSYPEIKDLPSNRIGYIVDGMWINFELDTSNMIDKIIIYYGP